MTQHTKEPWHCTYSKRLKKWYLFDQAKDLKGKIYKESDALHVVACLNTQPELLEALEVLMECSPCQNDCDPDDMTCASNKARAAIAKAKP